MTPNSKPHTAVIHKSQRSFILARQAITTKYVEFYHLRSEINVANVLFKRAARRFGQCYNVISFREEEMIDLIDLI